MRVGFEIAMAIGCPGCGEHQLDFRNIDFESRELFSFHKRAGRIHTTRFRRTCFH